MDYHKFEENKCRICLQDNVLVDWNDYLKAHDHLTYKDCYYKYTRLDCFDDNFYLSTMLCCDCTKNLENINAFVTKAVETHKILQERLTLNMECKHESDKELKTNFETVLISETEADMKEGDFCSITEENKSTTTHVSIFECPTKCFFEESYSWSIKEDNSPMYESNTKKFLDQENDSWSIAKDNEIKQTRPKIKQSRKRKSKKEEFKEDHTKTPADEFNRDKTILKKKRDWEIPTCCSICSKVLTSKYKAIQHEQTHAKNRQRNEICTECGMKFYNKTTLRCHMQIHMENREKSHKCEFCDKAFYTTGDLNIHRRKHLGLMIKCNLCTKEFCRQSELDKHMISHSAARISDDLKAKKKYFVHCEVCEENVRSTQYKSHSAKHMNEPLAKCALCNKEFFSRDSCVSHLKKFHKKASGERSNFVISYKTTRYSNLFLQQNVGEVYTKE